MYIESNKEEESFPGLEGGVEPHSNVLLIVEDFDSIRAFLSRHFIKRGFDVYSAVTTRDAVRLASLVKPKVVIVDFDLSRESAAKCVKQLKEVAPDTCVIVMGGPDTDASREVLADAGANRLLPKAYDVVKLDNLVKEFVNA